MKDWNPDASYILDAEARRRKAARIEKEQAGSRRNGRVRIVRRRTVTRERPDIPEGFFAFKRRG